VIETLRKGQRPSRGYLGVSLQPLDENIAASLGIPKDQGELVRALVPGQAGAKGGLQQGDVILRVGGQQVTPDQTVSYLIANSQVGARVPLEVFRDGKRQAIGITVGQRPAEEVVAKQAGGGSDDGSDDGVPTGPATKALGLSLQPLTGQIAQALSLPPGAHGVVVTAVDPSSDAADKGLKRGDVIISANRVPVTTPAQVSSIVAQARAAGRTSVLLLVKRGNSPEAFFGINIIPR
jgi:serine protease Do